MSQPDSKQPCSRRNFLTAILSACAAIAVGCRPAKAQTAPLLALDAAVYPFPA